jgi:murein DD-endopeptidase MepM/ murein hydrolase activator NlpD
MRKWIPFVLLLLMGTPAWAGPELPLVVTAVLHRSAGYTTRGAVFPIPGVERAGPHFAEGKFGAYRRGRRGGDCGRGHCGVDLCAPAGTTVVAIRAGKVEQIDRSGSGEGGVWIRVRHEDGSASWYMHLAQIRSGIAAGVEVAAGEPLASLGRTGVSTSPTHLHFALTVKRGKRERHVDPTRLLADAELTPVPLVASTMP